MSTKNTKVKIRPLGDRVLVRPMGKDEGKKTKSGIIIPETVDKERPEQGTVIAVGEGKMGESGNVQKMQIKVGDEIIFSKYGPDEVKVDDEEYFILSESNILAVIEK